jgi:hypothetical protein
MEKLDEKGNLAGEPPHEEHETLKEHNEKKRKK